MASCYDIHLTPRSFTEWIYLSVVPILRQQLTNWELQQHMVIVISALSSNQIEMALLRGNTDLLDNSNLLCHCLLYSSVTQHMRRIPSRRVKVRIHSSSSTLTKTQINIPATHAIKSDINTTGQVFSRDLNITLVFDNLVWSTTMNAEPGLSSIWTNWYCPWNTVSSFLPVTVKWIWTSSDILSFNSDSEALIGFLPPLVLSKYNGMFLYAEHLPQICISIALRNSGKIPTTFPFFSNAYGLTGCQLTYSFLGHWQVSRKIRKTRINCCDLSWLKCTIQSK